MKWKQIGKYAIESECKNWRISKSFIDVRTIYCLHDRGGKLVKYSDDVDVCKESARHDMAAEEVSFAAMAKEIMEGM